MEAHQAGSGNQRAAGTDTSQTAQTPVRQEGNRGRPDIPLLRASFFQVSIAGIAAVFVLASIGLAALSRETHADGTIPPGVFVAGTSIGEMDVDEARDHLVQEMSDYTSNPVSLVYGDRNWEPDMDEIGASFDLNLSLQDAQFKQSRIERIQSRIFGVDETEIPLQLRVDEAVLNAYVAGIAAEVDRDPVVPELSLNSGQLSLTDPVTGLTVDQEAVVQDIHASLYDLSHTSIEIPVTETEPDFDDSDIEAVKAMLTETLDGPVTLWFEDLSWSIEPEQLAEYLTLRQGDEGTVRIGFQEDEMYGFLDQLIGDINRPAQNATVAWGGESVVATSPSQNGIERDLHATISKLEEAVDSGERSVEVGYNVVRPAIDSNNLGELGIDGLMSQGESAFWNSSASRAHNIGVSAGYLDGTLIPPGTEFSFNQAVGEISPERGYQEGYVILAEETVPGVGGGVCQVSTTVFRAAFFSGLPITERHPHAYIVGFYEEGGWPLGFDAAIFQPSADFKFVNSTDSYMLMHTHVVDQKLYVNLYGPDLGYDVQLGEAVIQNETAPPDDIEILDESLAPGERRQVEFAKPGIEVTLPRTVTNRDGEIVRQDHFYSNFQAWGNRFLVGPSPEVEAQTPEEAPAPEQPQGEIIEEEVQVEESVEETTEESSD